MRARVALLALALCGCDQLLGLQKLSPLADAAIDAPPPPPRAHYDFEQVLGGSACLADVTDNAHDGTCAQGTPTLVPGPPGHGNAFAFDGATYLTIPYAADLDSTSGLTVAAWIAIDGYDASSGIDCAINRILGTAGANSWQMCFESSLGFFYFNGTQVNTPPPVLGQWMHVALVFDGTHASSWLNGDIVSLNLVTMPTYDSNIGIWLGADADPTPDVWLVGRIDDLYIYDRVLSADEIAALAR